MNVKKLLRRLKISYEKSLRLYKKGIDPWPEGEAGLKVRDHRQMVGGKWEELGSLQFNFLKDRGLKPNDTLCDVACGSFRAGRLFIEYLEPGNYLGIDKQAELIREGREKEVGESLWIDKRPEIVLSDRFEFSKFSKQPNYAIANSLFTHLSSNDVKLCLSSLKEIAAPNCKFYATYFQTDVKVFHVHSSHSSRRFEYTKSQMLKFGRSTGWRADYIGNWNHPAKQVLVCYTNQ